jgi:uncharacterized SAM-binding protein YcdF (DUF218 family)
MPIISKKLNSYLEGNYEPKKISNIENADAIVVLSGMLKPIEVKNNFKYEFNEKVDRIIAGIDLFKNKKAPIIILTRGKLPWINGKPEGEYLKDFAVKYGIPKENILLTESVQNTFEEAVSIKKLFPKKSSKIILITSAFHMARAHKIFVKENLNIIPYPVDFLNSRSIITFLDFMPSAYALNNTSNFVREIIGRIYYDIRY